MPRPSAGGWLAMGLGLAESGSWNCMQLDDNQRGASSLLTRIDEHDEDKIKYDR